MHLTPDRVMPLNLKAISAKWGLALCGLMLLTHELQAQTIDLKSQTLRYAVKYGKHNAGELEVIIERSQGQIKTTAISHLSFLARMFTTGLTAENWFSIEHKQAYLQRGHSLSQGNNPVERDFVIDRKQGLVTLAPKAQRIPINDQDMFVSSFFPINLMTRDVASIAGQTVQEVSAKRIREYIYLAPEQQTLELNGKHFETWKITRHRSDDDTRTVTLWLDKNNQHVPVKIIIVKKNKTTVMTLLPAS